MVRLIDFCINQLLGLVGRYVIGRSSSLHPKHETAKSWTSSSPDAGDTSQAPPRMGPLLICTESCAKPVETTAPDLVQDSGSDLRDVGVGYHIPGFGFRDLV